MSLALFLEQLFNGAITGSVYALLGSGLALIYGTMRVLNFAHGELFMLAGYFVLLGISIVGLPPIVAIALAVLAIAAVGAGIQRITLAPVMERENWSFNVIAITIGLSIVLQNGALLVWGERFEGVPYYFDGLLIIGDIRMPWQRMAILGFALLTMAAAAWLLYRTRIGQIVRATAQDAEAASAVGIPARHVHTFVFALAAAMAGIAAALLAPITSVNPWMGAPLLLKAFAVVIFGGLGSFRGAIAAGFILGIVEAVGVTLTSTEWKDVIAFTFLILAIWIRPYGLLGKTA